MYEADRWHKDPRIQSPMVIYKGEHIFVGDMVEFVDSGEEYLCGKCYGKVLNFMTKVHIFMQRAD